MCVCVCVRARARLKRERERERKVKTEERYGWWFVYCTDVFRLQGFVWIQKYFIKIIFVWEKVLIDNSFDSFGSLHKGLYMLFCEKQNNIGWYVLNTLCYAIKFFWKVNGILWYEKRICDVLLLQMFRESGPIFSVDFEIFKYHFSKRLWYFENDK